MASPPATPPTGPTVNEAGPVGLDLARLVPNPLHGAPPSKLALDDDGADSEDEYAACEDDGVPPPPRERELPAAPATAPTPGTMLVPLPGTPAFQEWTASLLDEARRQRCTKSSEMRRRPARRFSRPSFRLKQNFDLNVKLVDNRLVDMKTVLTYLETQEKTRVERRQAAELIYHIPAWLRTIPDIVLAALKLDPRILDPSLLDTPVMRRDKRNMTHVVSKAARERVEHCPGILFAVLKFLSAPDLARAGAASHLWHSTAVSESLWETLCCKFPLLGMLKETPGCRLSWKQLYVRRAMSTVQELQETPPLCYQANYQVLCAPSCFNFQAETTVMLASN
jgi:hypothetical protein